MSYTFQISYDGTTYVDYTNNVIRDSVEYSDRLHSDLKPNSNYATLQAMVDSTLKSHLINSDSPVFFKLSKDGTQILEGIVSPVFGVSNTMSGANPVKLKLEDFTVYRLKRRFSANINWSSYYVCNSSNASTSIVHQVLSLAGVTASSYPTIMVQIPAVVVNTEDKTTYFDFLSELLFEFGYAFYFGLDGKLCFYNFGECPTSLSSITNILRAEYGATGNNILGEMSTKSARGSYDAVKLTWYKKNLMSDLLLSEQTDYQSVPSGCYYPSLGSSTATFTEYSNPNYEIVGVVSATLTYDAIGMSLNQSLVNYGKRALFSLYNPNGFACNAKHTIKGSAWVKSDKGITTNNIRDDVVNTFEYECKYLYNSTNAQQLSTVLKNYYTYSKQGFEVTSNDYFALGSYVKVQNSTNDNFYGYGRVKQITYNKSGSYTYDIESITAYVNTDTSTTTLSSTANKNIITQSDLLSGSITANIGAVQATSIKTDIFQSAGSYVYGEVGKSPAIGDYRNYSDNDEFGIQKWEYQTSLSYIPSRCNTNDSEVGSKVWYMKFTTTTVGGCLYRVKRTPGPSTQQGIMVQRYVFSQNLIWENDYSYTLFEGSATDRNQNGAMIKPWGDKLLLIYDRITDSTSHYYATVLAINANNKLYELSTVDITSYVYVNLLVNDYESGYAIDSTHYLFGSYDGTTSRINCLVLSGNSLSITSTAISVVNGAFWYIAPLNATQYLAVLQGTIFVVFTVANNVATVVKVDYSMPYSSSHYVIANNVVVSFCTSSTNHVYYIRTWDGTSTWASTAGPVSFATAGPGYIVSSMNSRVFKFSGSNTYYLANMCNVPNQPTYSTGTTVYIFPFTYATGSLSFTTTQSVDLTTTGYTPVDQACGFVNMGNFALLPFEESDDITRIAQWGYNPAWVDKIVIGRGRDALYAQYAP